MEVLIIITIFLAEDTIASYVYMCYANRRPNRTIAICPACEEKYYIYVRGKWVFWEIFVWQIIAWATVWRLNPPYLLGVLLVFMLVIPTNVVFERLRFRYWFWRHPLRCQGGGHIAPAPTST